MGEPGLRQVIERHRDRLLAIEGIEGVAAGTTGPGRPCVIVFGQRSEWPAALPRELEGYPVELRRSGGFRAR